MSLTSNIFVLLGSKSEIKCTLILIWLHFGHGGCWCIRFGLLMCDGLLADMEKHSVKTVEKNLFGVNAIYLYCMLYHKCVKNVWLKL